MARYYKKLQKCRMCKKRFVVKSKNYHRKHYCQKCYKKYFQDKFEDKEQDNKKENKKVNKSSKKSTS